MSSNGFNAGLYSPRVAARIARIRYQNFQAWAKASLLHPAFQVQIGQKRESIYSYRDLLLIRLIKRLRDRGFKPKTIKRTLDVVAQMSGGDPHAWMKATFYVEEGLIAVILPGQSEWNPIAASKGPQKLAVIFFPELIKELQKELVPEKFRYIEIDPQVLGGSPVVKGTRIPTRAVYLVKKQGHNPRDAYPDLTAKQIREAYQYEEFLAAA
jgi:uncharacterized protein (DUF433 family)